MKTESVKAKVCQEEDSLFFPRGGARSKTNKRYERWNLEENRDYVEFLRNNESMFNDPIGRRSTAIYNKMAVELDNGRNNHQCRSHHMKMLKKYTTLEGIIAHILDDPRLDRKGKVLSDHRKNTEIDVSDAGSVGCCGEASREIKSGEKQLEYKVKKGEDVTGNFDPQVPNKPELAFPSLRLNNILIQGPAFGNNLNSRSGEGESVLPFSLNRSSSAFKLVHSNEEGFLRPQTTSE